MEEAAMAEEKAAEPEKMTEKKIDEYCGTCRDWLQVLKSQRAKTKQRSRTSQQTADIASEVKNRGVSILKSVAECYLRRIFA